MAHAQKPDFVFRRNGRVHLNRRGSQFSRLLAAEVCASALVMLDTPRSEVVWEYWLHTPFASFPFTSPPVRHRVPSGFKRAIRKFIPRWSILKMRNVSGKRFRENQNAHFMFNIFLRLLCHRWTYVKYSADKMRFAWRVIKARMQIYTHTL